MRLFGTRDNNRWQYNIAYFRRLEKDTNSGLNDLGAAPARRRRVRRQPVSAGLPGARVHLAGDACSTTATARTTSAYYNQNDFIERPASLGREVPREYDVGLHRLQRRRPLRPAEPHDLGLLRDRRGDAGRVRRRRTSTSARCSPRPSCRWTSTGSAPRISLLYGSGDDDPFDDRATGFDAVFENPQFAGADTSYWIRQAVPLIGGGRVALSGRNGVLAQPALLEGRGAVELHQSGHPARRARRRHGRAADAARFAEREHAVLRRHRRCVEVARNQGPIDKHIGYDVSAALTWRPMMSQNIVLRASYATLLAGDGFDALFPDDRPGLLPAQRDLQLLRSAPMSKQKNRRSGTLRASWSAVAGCGSRRHGFSRARLRSRARRRAQLRHRAAGASEPDRRVRADEERRLPDAATRRPTRTPCT